MSHLEERLQHDLTEIRDRVAAMASDVEQAVDNAFRALQTGDEQLAFSTILSDHPINRAMRQIDKLCHAFIAVHLPSAGHLRLLSSVIRANIIIERIGDYAVTIAREAIQLHGHPEGHVALDLQRMSDEVRLALGQSISAFNELNADQARNVITLVNQLERSMDSIYAEVLDGSEGNVDRSMMIIFIIFSQLKRVADQAKNLCEETIFAATGETKAPKVYNVLFVDEDNSCLAPMAEAIARKIFPEIGRYSGGGSAPASALNSAMVDFMAGQGMDLGNVKPRQVDTTRRSLSEYHVIVGLNQPVRQVIGDIPFRSSALNWGQLAVPQDGDKSDWEELYKNLALQIRELMMLLRGSETD